MFAIAPSLLQVINASAFAPSGPGPSVAGVPLSSSEPVFRNLDDALEWCEEVLLQAHVKSAPVTTSPPPSLSPPPLSPPRANGNALASALTTHSTWPPAAGAAHVAQGDGPVDEASPPTGLARHPSYYRTVSASRSPTSAKVPNDAAKSPPIDPSVGALVVILEDYLQLPAASSPLRHPPAQAALAHHFRRLLVGTLIDRTHSMRAAGARSFETPKGIRDP